MSQMDIVTFLLGMIIGAIIVATANISKNLLDIRAELRRLNDNQDSEHLRLIRRNTQQIADETHEPAWQGLD